MKLRTYTDGGARGNPGLAAIGVLICDAGDEIIAEHGECIGEATNNVAEYRALIEGLRRAREFKPDELECFLDSELVVKQIRGEYKLKNYNLQKLFDEAQKEIKTFRTISFHHLRREAGLMPRADQLVNWALDEEARKRK